MSDEQASSTPPRGDKSAQNLIHHPHMHIGQSEVAASECVGQAASPPDLRMWEMFGLRERRQLNRSTLGKTSLALIAYTSDSAGRVSSTSRETNRLRTQSYRSYNHRNSLSS